METKSWITIDRKAQGWPSGEWDDEPDKIQWSDKVTGLPCLAVRHETSGHWCGYVGVPNNHVLYGVEYSDVPWEIQEDVHGSLTFSQKCTKDKLESEGVCHRPGDGETDDIWWFGFDCAHSDDITPILLSLDNGRFIGRFSAGHHSYKSIRYIQAECKSFAEKLAV